MRNNETIQNIDYWQEEGVIETKLITIEPQVKTH